MGQLLYYLVLLPVSKLPLGVLYGLSNLAYFLGYKVFGYRTEVVRQNMRSSFPEWDEATLEKQVKAFYHYFTDSIVESVKLFSMSLEEARRRNFITNPEVLHPYAEQGRSVIIVGAHYANWEMSGLSFPGHFPRQNVMAIYSPMSNERMDKLIKANRERAGVYLVSRRKVKEYYTSNPLRPSVDFFVADQSPSNHDFRKVHWTPFLHRPTGFVTGPERYAAREDLPVYYCALRVVKRGYYEATLSLITETPKEEAPGFITEAFARKLEAEIQRDPTPWLWTHRRWKRPAPAEVVEGLKTVPYLPAGATYG